MGGVAVLMAGCAEAAAPDTAAPQPSSVHPSTTPAPTASSPTPSPVASSPSPTATATSDELYGLAPLLAERFRAAQKGAAAAGLTLTLTSGWRDPAFQQHLLDEKVRETGSLAEAEKWVLPPDKSEHCKGMAIDVGPTIREMSWLEAHQGDYGLCRRYDNEPWHFELSYPNGSCPARKATAAEA